MLKIIILTYLSYIKKTLVMSGHGILIVYLTCIDRVL